MDHGLRTLMISSQLGRRHLMRARFLAFGAAALLAAAILVGYCAPAVHATGPIPVNCDRACLEGLINQYLAALVAHDPKRLPLAADVKYTENEQVMDIGDGFWNTVTGMGNYKHYFADPAAQQAGFMGTMQESDHLVLMGVRLRVVLGRIEEVETTYFRQGSGGLADVPGIDAMGKPEAVWLEPIPPAQRVSRQQLIAIANMYFAGLQNDDGKGVYPFSDDCKRLEDGMQTTNNPKLGTPTNGFNAFALGCKAQFETGFYAVVTRIHHRRFPLVDEERGVVWACVIFDHNGTHPVVKLTDGREIPMRGFNRPSSIDVVEAFKIENGLIRRIEMVGSGVPYHFNTAWEGGVGDR
jgi:hypothetical protein